MRFTAAHIDMPEGGVPELEELVKSGNLHYVEVIQFN
jgi:hypothetical protein